MDLSNSKTTPSDIPIKYYSNNAPFHSTYRRHAFPFRDTLIHYITMNPSSPKVYQKMIQSCKHFFIKNSIIVVPELWFYGNEGWYTQGRYSKDRPNDRSVYLNKIASKIWITDSFVVCGITSNCPTVTSFMSKIYQCDARSIFISYQMFSFNDFMVIASKCQILELSHVVIMNNDEVLPETEEYCFETAVSLDALVKVLPNVKSFRYYLPENSVNIITSKTAEELLKLPHFLTLDKFDIYEIPETFDIKCFFGHIKENKKTKIQLYFSSEISDEYKTRLQTIVNEILVTENRDYKVPMIDFDRITISSREKMHALYRQN